MNSKDNARILIFYSLPGNLPRLGLGREERAIDDVLRDLHLDSSLIRRVHATSIEDLTRVLQEGEFEIIQFSGHGYKEGIFLEDRHTGAKVPIPAEKIAQLLHDTSHNRKAVIFMACYSSESTPELLGAAPYLITIDGAADDESAISYIAQFYAAYLRTGSIERAYNMALNFLEPAGLAEGLLSILNRRALVKGENRVLYQAFPSGKSDSILIDLTEAEADIASLNISRDEFLSDLSRRIRVHRWIFKIPREKVVLSIGSYFGEFSWQDASDVVNCNRILKIRSEVSRQTREAWVSLVVIYNDHYVDAYRTTLEPQDPKLANSLPKTLDEYFRIYRDFFDTGEKARLLFEVAPDLFNDTSALISANLSMADSKLHSEDYASVARYIEATLSAIHNFLENLTDLLSVKN